MTSSTILMIYNTNNTLKQSHWIQDPGILPLTSHNHGLVHQQPLDNMLKIFQLALIHQVILVRFALWLAIHLQGAIIPLKPNVSIPVAFRSATPESQHNIHRSMAPQSHTDVPIISIVSCHDYMYTSIVAHPRVITESTYPAASAIDTPNTCKHLLRLLGLRFVYKALAFVAILTLITCHFRLQLSNLRWALQVYGASKTPLVLGLRITKSISIHTSSINETHHSDTSLFSIFNFERETMPRDLTHSVPQSITKESQSKDPITDLTEDCGSHVY